ncbi:MAG: rhomboid family intramembrane serine protease [Candidatus Azobacteroides sp.]|nr:rhomboid family intramembrane serine protease [Candidatus Azobacteroides sp.]
MDLKFEKKRILYALFFPALFIILLWLVLFVEKAWGADWSQWGIYPGKISGLRGIFTSPFIHADAKHLFSNSVPLLVLSWCLFYFYKDLGYGVFPILWILSGLLTWIFGRDSLHIGASGLTYSLAFFLFFSGVFRRYIPLMAVSLIVVFLYGSTVWNMFPVAEIIDPSISWEGHLAGAISGFVCALIFRKRGPQNPEPEEEEEEDDDDNEENEEIENLTFHCIFKSNIRNRYDATLFPKFPKNP